MPNRRQIIAFVATAPALALIGQAALAASAQYYNDSGIAIDGTDAVAYFTEGRPVEGSPEFTHEWSGVTWHFSTAANRDTFATAPEKYAPQYGGYCAWAVAEGYTASTTPEAWKVVDGKLYLNYSRRIQRRWEGDIPGFISAADINWPAVLN